MSRHFSHLVAAREESRVKKQLPQTILLLLDGRRGLRLLACKEIGFLWTVPRHWLRGQIRPLVLASLVHPLEQAGIALLSTRCRKNCSGAVSIPVAAEVQGKAATDRAKQKREITLSFKNALAISQKLERQPKN